MSRVVAYQSGANRVPDTERSGVTHTYAVTAAGNLWPMCDYGWNRSDGKRFSIWRGSIGTFGKCKRCAKNVAAGKRPVLHARPHKTKYL